MFTIEARQPNTDHWYQVRVYRTLRQAQAEVTAYGLDNAVHVRILDKSGM